MLQYDIHFLPCLRAMIFTPFLLHLIATHQESDVCRRMSNQWLEADAWYRHWPPISLMAGRLVKCNWHRGKR